MQFENFLADMGDRPEQGTIDRIDNDGNYEPSNCRWVSNKENCYNRPRTIKVIWNGKEISLKDLATAHGISPQTLSNRINNLGWEQIESATTPVDVKKRNHRAKV